MNQIAFFIIGILLITSAAGSGFSGEVSSFSSSGNTSTLILQSPKEGETLWLDVVPPHAAITGSVNASNPIKEIHVGTAWGVTPCGNTTLFACEVPVVQGKNSIAVTAVDITGNAATELRNFTVEIGLPPPGTIEISGTISDSNGKPVSNATVTAESGLTRDNVPLSVSTQSDERGMYTVMNAQGYRQTLRVSKEGYAPVEREIVFENTTNIVDFTLHRRDLPVPGFDGAMGTVALIAGMAVIGIFSRQKRMNGKSGRHSR